MYKRLEEFISVKSKIMYNEDMSKHTSFKVGGYADCFIIVDSTSELIQIIKFLKSENIKFFIIGNGSNLLVSDNGFRGVIIKLGEGFKDIQFNENFITIGSACSINYAAQACLEKSLAGFEWAFGIPGSLGGAVFMNAGAYGGVMQDVVYETSYINENLELCTLKNEEHEFGYRKSVFKSGKIKGIIVSITLKLQEGNKNEIWQNMQKYINARIEKQPLNMPSAGSTFKRPDGHFVGKMIEELNLKGFSIGGAEVSTKHGGFIVNKGNAKAQDIKDLIEYIKKKVKEKYDVELETEVLEVGE